MTKTEMRTRPICSAGIGPGRPARALFLLVVALGGSALADPAPNLPFPSEPVGPRLVQDVASAGPQIIKMFGESTPRAIKGSTLTRVLPKAGRFIKFGAAYIVAPILAQAALEWMFSSLKSSGDKAFDSWWNSFDPSTYPPYPTQSQINSFPDGVWTKWHENADGAFEFQSGGRGWAWNIRCYKGGSLYVNSDNRAYQGLDGAPAGYATYLRESQACSAQTLNDFLNANPGSKDVIPNAIGRYLQDNPSAGRSLFSPSPNANQWTDNPYTDPDLDGDGDGFPDSYEYEKGSNPDDPKSVPKDADIDPNKIVRQNKTTVKNPDGSITTTTTTEYADGRKKVTKATTSTTTTKNPDGSTTTTKTTTTTTERYSETGEKTSSSTTTAEESETTPAKDPEKDPDNNEAACKAAGGTWNGKSCDGEEEPKEEEEETPKPDDFDTPSTPFAVPDTSKFPAPESGSITAPTIDPPGDVFKAPEESAFKVPKFDDLSKKWNDGLQKVKEDAGTRFPFGLANPATQLTAGIPTGDGSACQALRYQFVQVAGTSIAGEIDPCHSEMADWMHSLLRPALAWFFVALTVFGCSRLAATS